MRRAKALWPQLTSWANLIEALRRAASGKRSRPDVAAFLSDQESGLARIRASLLDGSYRPGPYRVFELVSTEEHAQNGLAPAPNPLRVPPTLAPRLRGLCARNKRRRISAAPFADRVVHHALTQVLEPVFEPRFSPFSFACRTGFGSHRALDTIARAACRGGYALCLDVKKYFASIDHSILESQLERAIGCRQTLDLASRIIAGSNEQEPTNWYFPGDDLFTPFDRRRGIPLGNQTSQFFANVYLDPLDHFIQRGLRPAAYGRYVDDLVLLDPDKDRLREARVRIEAELDRLRLRLHPGKSRIYRVQDGITFLGWRIFPDRRRLVRENVVRFRRKLRDLRDGWESGDVEKEEIRQSVMAWIGHAMHGDTWRLREQIFSSVVFPPRKPQPAQKFSSGGFAAVVNGK